MRQLIPNFIIQKMAAGNMSGSFPAAGVFIDISGFSSITESLMEHGQHGAEVLTELVKYAFEPLVESVYAHGGFVATISGDALVVFFIAESGEPPAVHRALVATQEGQARLAGTQEQHTKYGTFTMSTKAGIATGNVDWSIVSGPDEKRIAYYFRGEAVDGSAAAEKLAGRGEIWLTPDAYAQAQALVVAEEVNDHFRVRDLIGELPPSRSAGAAPVDPELAARFYPPDLLDQPFEGEFRQVVAMFIGFPAQRTPEQMTAFIQQIFRLQERYGGLFNHLKFGDKGAHVLLIWGAPVAYENDIERALNFILDLQAESVMPVNAGITYSIAFAGFSGSSFRQDYTAYGRGVNLASRIMGVTPRGETWVDEHIAGRAGRLFECEFVSEELFEGLSRPQKVFALLERKEADVAFLAQPMVGRDAELERLINFVLPILNQKMAGLMLITGEAGIGKSHLVHHLQRTKIMKADDVRWALCQTDEILRESLNPFVYWLRRYFGQEEKQSEASNKRIFDRRLERLIAQTSDERLAAELDRLRSCLGALLGLYWSDSLYTQLDARGRYENTMQGLIALIQAESRQKPLVVLIEDAHWLDDDSKNLLSRLLPALQSGEQGPYPVAIVVTARPEVDLALAEDVPVAEIRLGELSHGVLFTLAQAHLGGPPGSDLLELLHEHAQGNPFFAVQMLYYLRDRRLLAESRHGWRLVDTHETLLPPDVRALLVARLDTLESQVKEAVQTAAILGREFELSVLGRMLGREPSGPLDNRLSQTLIGLVDQAEQAAIWSALTQIRYIFRHALLRDVAYDMQLQSRLQALHALAATTLETLYAEDQNAPYAELAYHAERAGMTEKACRYLKLAGDKATDAFQNGLALQYYGRALNLTPAGDSETRFDILMARAKLYHLTGEREAQGENLTLLEETAVGLGDRYLAQANLEKARRAGVIGQLNEAIAAISESVQLAQAVGFVSELARGHLLWGWYLYRQSNFSDARAHYEKAKAYAQEANMPAEEANSLNGLGILAMEEGDYAGSQAYLKQARERYRQAGRLTGEGNILNNLAVLASRQSQFVAAKQYSEEALALRRQIGDRKGEGNTANNLGEMCRALGEFANAKHYYAVSLAIRREVGDRRGEALVLLSMAILATDFGDYARADQLLKQALVIVRDSEDLMLVGVVLMHQGSVAVEDGDVETGLSLCAQAVAVLQQVDHRIYLGHAYRRLGMAQYQAGQLEAAQAAYQQATEIGAQMDAILLAHAEAGLADVALAESREEAALGHIEKVLEQLAEKPIVELEEPFPLAISCYRVLARHADPRAGEILQTVYELLQDRAEGIAEPDLRHLYLNRVPAHKEIIVAYESQQR